MRRLASIALIGLALAACQAPATPDRTDEILDQLERIERSNLIVACEVAQTHANPPADAVFKPPNGCDALRAFDTTHPRGTLP